MHIEKKSDELRVTRTARAGVNFTPQILDFNESCFSFSIATKAQSLPNEPYGFFQVLCLTSIYARKKHYANWGTKG